MYQQPLHKHGIPQKQWCWVVGSGLTWHWGLTPLSAKSPFLQAMLNVEC